MRIELPSGTPAERQLVDGARRGLVVFPDIFGLRPLFTEHVERFAMQWRVSTVAIEPFGTRSGLDDLDARFAAVATLRDADIFRDLGEAARATECESVGLIGFCMGGMYCFKAAGLECFDHIASFYGMIHTPEQWSSPTHADPLEYVRSANAHKVLAIIGSKDTWTPPEHVRELREAGVNVVEYAQAEHGFAHDESRPAHRAEDAADAFARARDWLT